MTKKKSDTENHCSGHILVVEDSLVQAEVLTELLKDNGYQVKTAKNGRIAFEMALRETPALVISDILMPEMDGFELTRQIRNDPHLAPVPILLLTSLTDASDVAHALFCGADTFVSKPYNDTFLLNKIGLLLEKKGRKVKQDEKIIPFQFVYEGEEYEITASREKIIEFLLTTYDLTIERNRALNRAENELRDLNTRLEERVTERTNELEKLNDELQAKNKKIATAEEELREQYLVLAEQVSRTRESEKMFRTLIETAHDAIYIFKVEASGPGRILLANTAASEMLGYTNEEFLNLSVTDLNDPNYETPIPSPIEMQEPDKTFEYAYLTKNGRSLPVEISLTLFGSDGRTLAVSIVRDISDRKKAESELKRGFAERSALLSEIHHRVNNNLQVLLSMMTLEEISHQTELTTNTFAKTMCSNMEFRIRAIALVHENLYQSGELTGIRLHEYLCLLAQEILTSEIGRVYITYTVEGGENVVVPMDKAVLLSLTFSEILTNTLKHAFSDNERGTVRILISEESGLLCIDISDDGIGLPSGTDLSNGDSVGLSIIYNVVTVQLKGTIELLGRKGTAYHICIPGTFRP